MMCGVLLMTVTERSQKKRVFCSIFTPPLVFVPIGVPLFLFGVDVSIIRDAWYLSIFSVACI